MQAESFQQVLAGTQTYCERIAQLINSNTVQCINRPSIIANLIRICDSLG